MRKVLTQLQSRYQALKPRERIIVGGGLLAGIFLVYFNVFVQASSARYSIQNNELQTLQTNLVSLQQNIAALKLKRTQDPNQEIKQRLLRTTQSIEQLDGQLKQKLHGLIEPAQMSRVLEAMLKQNSQLQLQRVQSKPAVPLLDEEEEAESNKVVNNAQQKYSGLYRHAVEIEFTGNYLATLNYLQALQELPWDFYWDSVRFEVDQYPQARVIITVHTLSLHEGWIGV